VHGHLLALAPRGVAIAQAAPRARACGGATHRRLCRDGEDLPAESWNAVDQLALPGPDPARVGSLLSAHPHRGRAQSGRLYSTPVDIIELDDQRWLVAGYGPTNWVRNVRAAGEVTLSRGRQSEHFRVEEADRSAAVPALRKYMSEIRVTRPYFDASPDSADEDVAAELPRHPVFHLIPVVNGGRQTDAAT
jgi:deazaflavin-dependent oxidoreductase (nitroreductase family)